MSRPDNTKPNVKNKIIEISMPQLVSITTTLEPHGK